MFHVPPPDAEAEPVEADGRERRPLPTPTPRPGCYLHETSSVAPDCATDVGRLQRRRGGVQEEHAPERRESKLSGAHGFTRRHLSGEAARGGPSRGHF